MKKRILHWRFILLFLLSLPFICFSQNVDIPDPNFKKYLVGHTDINTNRDEEIQISEASAFNGWIQLKSSEKIITLKGIESFSALTHLDCDGLQLISLDISKNTALTELRCSGNQLTSLDVSKNTALTRLDCRNNQLTSLDVSNNNALIDLDCEDNNLTNLVLSKNSALTELDCSGNDYYGNSGKMFTFDCDALKKSLGLE